MPESKPEELIENRPRVVRTRERHGPLRAEEPLHAARGDLTEREVLELRPHAEAEIITVVLLRPIRQLAQLQILEPQISEVTEGAAEIEQASGPEPRPVQQALLQTGSRGRFRPSSTRHSAQTPDGVTDARKSHIRGAAPADADGSV